MIASTHHQYGPHCAALTWLTLGVLALLTVGGCRHTAPSLDARPAPAVDATISGTIRGPVPTSSIDGRLVSIVNVETNERQRVATDNAGGFTVKVKPGKYRIEITLHDGESIVRQPGMMNMNRADIDAHADFVIGTARVFRPRGPAYRRADGLGSPIA